MLPSDVTLSSNINSSISIINLINCPVQGTKKKEKLGINKNYYSSIDRFFFLGHREGGEEGFYPTGCNIQTQGRTPIFLPPYTTCLAH